MNTFTVHWNKWAALLWLLQGYKMQNNKVSEQTPKEPVKHEGEDTRDWQETALFIQKKIIRVDTGGWQDAVEDH